MRKSLIAFITISAVLLGLSQTGCDPMRKMAKSDEIADKDSAAVWYYEHKKYDRAVFLFEELMPAYRPTERFEVVYYYYAYCRYFLGELVSASFYFDDFAKKFPNSKHAEECEFMTAKCYYLLSDPHQLDQKYTLKAIDQYQLFLSRHPYTDKKEQCMTHLGELRERLAKKSFEQASLYYKIGYFKAAVEAFKIMIDDFPDSGQREQAEYMLAKSALELAKVSTQRRKASRYEEAILYAERFDSKYTDSKFNSDAKNMLEAAEKGLEEAKLAEERRKEELLYQAFVSNMERLKSASSVDMREDAYQAAVDRLQDLKEDYPQSDYIAKASKQLNKYDSKSDEK